MLLPLDEGDTTTITERALIPQGEDEGERGTDGMPTRKSTRSRTTTSYLFKFYVMVKDISKLKYVLGTKSSFQTSDTPDNPHPKVRMERDMNQMNNKQYNLFKIYLLSL